MRGGGVSPDRPARLESQADIQAIRLTTVSPIHVSRESVMPVNGRMSERSLTSSLSLSLGRALGFQPFQLYFGVVGKLHRLGEHRVPGLFCNQPVH